MGVQKWFMNRKRKFNRNVVKTKRTHRQTTNKTV